MHEGTVCREIIDIVSKSAIENDIRKVYEIIVAIGPYSCIHEKQLNFYFDILKAGTCMQDAAIVLEKDETLMGISQMVVKTYKGE